MNERIQELMDQTGVPVSMPFDKWCEKFAELIVRECVKIAYQNDIAKFTKDGYVIGQAIEKHFGVE